jgi:SAM-dependent methyltransferase/uncharacterized protein YbaR (Trm112 family)
MDVLEILACTTCRGSLAGEGGVVACTECSREYQVEAGVPIMYESAEPPEAVGVAGPVARVLHRMADDPRIYDVIQRAVGFRKIARRLEAVLEGTKGVILDVGAGTGAIADIAPAESHYIWFDYDRQKLAGFRNRRPTGHAVIGSASRLPFTDKSADSIVFVDVSHHLDDEALKSFLAEAARVTRGTVLFVDALRIDAARNRLLWRYDAGARPRELHALRSLVEEFLTLEHVETFRVVHDYVFFRARPRA